MQQMTNGQRNILGLTDVSSVIERTKPDMFYPVGSCSVFGHTMKLKLKLANGIRGQAQISIPL